MIRFIRRLLGRDEPPARPPLVFRGSGPPEEIMVALDQALAKAGFERAGIPHEPPAEAADRWVTEECKCGGHDGKPHYNDYRTFEPFLLVARADVDGYIWEWQIIYRTEAMAHGWAMDQAAAQAAAEACHAALAYDRSFYYGGAGKA